VDAESWVVTGPQVIEADDVQAVHAAIVGGRVDVVGRDEPGARIEVHRVDGRPLDVSVVGGELRVGYSFTLGGWEGFVDRLRSSPARDSVEVSIAVHREVAARLGTVTGDGLLAGTVGSSSVSTVSGAIVTDGTRGVLTATTVSGDLALREHNGGLRANAVSGSVTASGAFAQVGLSTVSGAVTVDATAAAGIAVKTVSGDITVRVPHDLGLRLSARAVSGRVVVDGRELGSTTAVRGTVEDTTGDGRTRLGVHTVSGHLTVVRAAPVQDTVDAGTGEA
jgi:hypothetical protein